MPPLHPLLSPAGAWSVSDGEGGERLQIIQSEVSPPGSTPMIGSTLVTSIIEGGTLSEDSGHAG